ncbi:MAG: NAD(P)/FAD-dependent oxidoreductase [Planctomycetia bacterium]|nr:NAD(P)/FAD-dependent oxidoreductase [Planctomycetia bacterium]
MSTTTRYSAIVVGGSLSGLMAARALREKGLADFVVLDRKPRLGSPLKCGEAVEASTFDQLFGPGARFPFVKQTITSHSVMCRGHARSLEDVPQLRFYETDRPQFERWLGQPVQEHLQFSTTVQSVERVGADICVETNRGRMLTRGLIIGCGAHYELQKRLGMVEATPSMGYACGELHEVSGSEREQDKFAWHILERCEGYGWLFPKGADGCNLGVLAFGGGKLQDVLAEFKRDQQVKSTAQVRFGGRFPQNGPIRHTVADSVIACGDAAGMVFAATGEGIRYALRSGRWAGQVMADAVAKGDTTRRRLTAYETRWRASFGRELRAGVQVKELLMALRRSGHLGYFLKRLSDQRLADFMLGKQRYSIAWLSAAARIADWIASRASWQMPFRLPQWRRGVLSPCLPQE